MKLAIFYTATLVFGWWMMILTSPEPLLPGEIALLAVLASGSIVAPVMLVTEYRDWKAPHDRFRKRDKRQSDKRFKFYLTCHLTV